MTADEYEVPKSKYFILFEVPDNLFLNGKQSSRKPLEVHELRRIFRQETVLLPNGTSLQDLDWLKRRHDVSLIDQYTYDPNSLSPERIDHVVVLSLGDQLKIWDYTGFTAPTLEHDPCMM